MLLWYVNWRTLITMTVRHAFSRLVDMQCHELVVSTCLVTYLTYLGTNEMDAGLSAFPLGAEFVLSLLPQ